MFIRREIKIHYILVSFLYLIGLIDSISFFIVKKHFGLKSGGRHMKRNTFTSKIMITLILGMITGIGMIFLREGLIANNHANIWKGINNLLFADITQEANKSAIGIMFIVGQIFMRILQLVLIPLIFTSIIRAIQHIEETRVLNKLAKKTFGNFIVILSLSILVAVGVGFTVYNLGWFQIANLDSIEIAQGVTNATNPLMIILNAFNNNVVATLGNNGNIIAVVVLALVVGVIIQILGDQIQVIKKLVDEIYLITMKLLDFVILKLGPVAIYCLLVRTLASYGTDYLRPALIYMVVTVVTLLFTVLVVFPTYIYIKTGLNPFAFIKKMYKVGIFGFSTSSSAATLPLAQETIINDLGVDSSVASFVVPLASTINMTGTAIMQIIATLFIASVAGYQVGVLELISIVLLTVVGSISTPAAPGSGAILLFTIISGMGYVNQPALAAYSFILAINRPVEMLVTAVNVIDDGVSAVCVSKEMDALDLEIYNSETSTSNELVIENN